MNHVSKATADKINFFGMFGIEVILGTTLVVTECGILLVIMGGIGLGSILVQLGIDTSYLTDK
jgi:hypothetical protein